VRLNPSVIVSATIPANLARGATDTIPIVTAAGGDPVAFGLVKSLPHQGGNVTDLATFAELLASKQIDLLRELMPHLSRLAMLVDVSDPVHLLQLRETMAAATANGITLVPIEIASIDELQSHRLNGRTSVQRICVLTILRTVTALTVGLPAQRAIAQRFRALAQSRHGRSS